MTSIGYAREPNRLKLIWQAASSPNRKKFVVGELVRAFDRVALAYHTISQDFMEARQNGFFGHPAFPIDTRVHHINVLEIFSTRLPARHRSDFNSYLAKHRLENFPHLSNFALLGYTGGALPGDGFAFAIDFFYEDPPHQFLMEVAGFRYHAGMNLEISDLMNQFVLFEPDLVNIHDPFAVKITVNGVQIGYVPRYHSQLFRYWLANHAVYGSIERIDGTLTKPQVYLMMHVLTNASSKRLIPPGQAAE